MTVNAAAKLAQPDALGFVTAGDAIFTLVSTKTGARFTYRVQEASRPGSWFVKLLSGPDNVRDYRYMGLLTRTASGALALKATQGSKVSSSAPSWAALDWSIRVLHGAAEVPTLEVWHEGRCGRCGRRLTVPESIAKGLGPDCAEALTTTTA